MIRDTGEPTPTGSAELELCFCFFKFAYRVSGIACVIPCGNLPSVVHGDTLEVVSADQGTVPDQDPRAFTVDDPVLRMLKQELPEASFECCFTHALVFDRGPHLRIEIIG